MADRLRIVTKTGDGRAPVTLYDLSNGSTIEPVRDSLTVTAPEASTITSAPQGRWGGNRTVAETHGNSSVALRLLVRGATADATLTLLDKIVQNADSYITYGDSACLEWRPDGASYSTYYRLRGAPTWDLGYRWITFVGTRSLEVGVTFPVAPLAEGDDMDIWEDFAPRGSIVYTNLVQYYAERGDTTGWIPRPQNDAVGSTTSSTDFAKSGTRSYKLIRDVDAGGANTIYINNAGHPSLGVATIACSPGDYHAISAEFRAATVGRTCTAVALWYDAAGTSLTNQSGTGVTNTTTGWTRSVGVVGPAPANAAFLQIRAQVQSVAEGEAHYVDEIMVVKVPSATTAMPSYFDGDTDKGEWTGAPYSSTSNLRSTSAIEDYTAASPAPAVASSRMIVNANTGNTFHTARGYPVVDVQATVKATVTAVGANTHYTMTPSIKWLPTDNRYFWATVEASALRIYYRDGLSNALIATTAATQPALGDTRWVRLRSEGNLLTAELWTAEPTATGVPTTTVSFTMTESTTPRGSDMGAGRAGHTGPVGWRPNAGTVAEITDFKSEPFTYPARNLPDEFDLSGVPGDAPALMDVVLRNTASWPASKFITIGWGDRTSGANLVVAGDFEDPAINYAPGMWLSTGMAFNVAPTGATVVSTQAKFGTKSLSVTTPATAAAGPEYKIYRKFRKGVPYTASLWHRGSDATPASIVFGFTGDFVTTTAVASNGLWTLHTVTWTPTADRDMAVLAPRTSTATATTYYIDAASVYEGTLPPTARAAEGLGGFHPVGVHEAESGISLPAVLTTDATARGGRVLRYALSGAGVTATPGILLNTSLLGPETFGESVTLEVFARAVIPTTAVSPSVALRLTTDAASGGIAAVTYSQEYGSVGKTLLTSATAQFLRLGTVVVPTFSLRSSSRTYLSALWSTAAGSTGNLDIDYFFVVPAVQRASGITGKASATVPYLAEASSQKRFRSDLVGFVSSGDLRAGEALSSGLGGAAMEINPGNPRVVIQSSASVPDDPAGNLDATVNRPTSLHFGITPRYRIARGA